MVSPSQTGLRGWGSSAIFEIPWIVAALTPLLLGFVVYWDASKREIAHRYAWTIGAIATYLVVGVLYFVVNRGEGRRVSSTGYLLAGLEFLQAIASVPYAARAYDPLMPLVILFPTVTLLVVWYFLG